VECGLQNFVVNDIFSDWSAYRRSFLQAKAIDDSKPSLNVLSLSAGGEFGAYGAGFLNGWSSAGSDAKPSPRSDIQIVTGVSTGAILATHVFLGLDKEILETYRSLSGSRIYRSRWLVELLTANSVLDAAGKDKLIDENLKGNLVDQVASAAPGRFLYLGAVDLDSGRFLRIDMVKLARSIQPKERRDACYKAVVGASSAIPVMFPPKFVDKMMLVDGGARRHLFITEPPAEARQPNVERRLYSIIHGDLTVGCQQTSNGIIAIAARTAELASDQSFKDSIRLADSLAQKPVSSTDPRPLFNTFYAAAGGGLNHDLFCQRFMNCLADEGEADGKAYAEGSRPWLSFDELNLSSDSNCNPSSPLRPFVR
jgi:hypothetical protein